MAVVVSRKSAYTYAQDAPTATWTITHNLGYQPSVTVVDSAGNEWFGTVQYLGTNVIVIRFSAPFSGKAYLS